MTKETNAEYHADFSRQSNSLLTLLEEDPELYKATVIDKTYKRVETKTMIFGHLLHTITFEPERFSEAYAVVPKVNRRTTLGRAQWAEFEFEADKKQLVDEEQVKLAIRCVKRLRANKTIKRHLADERDVLKEYRIDFVFAGMDFRCKLDWVKPDAGIILDAKSTRVIQPLPFAAHAVKFGYHRQSALYKIAAEQHFGRPFRFVMACVRPTTSLPTAAYEFDEAGHQAGIRDAEALCDQLRVRCATDNWLPDYSQGEAPTAITVPRWHKTPELEAMLYYLNEDGLNTDE
jgi:hypothetical protein